MTGRRPLVWLLVLTLVLTAWAAGQDDDELAPRVASGGSRLSAAERPDAGRRPPSGPAGAGIEWPSPPADRRVVSWRWDEAGMRAWVPVPSPAAPVAVPARSRATPVAQAAPLPPPGPPPFPFQYLGRVVEAGRTHVLLSDAQRTLGVTLDAVIDGQWRIDAIADSGISYTWLPGGQRGLLPIRPS